MPPDGGGLGAGAGAGASGGGGRGGGGGAGGAGGVMAGDLPPRLGGISGRQAFMAIALVFFLGVLIGVGIGVVL